MRDILYYDGQCPLCAKEMERLRALKDDHLELVDIHDLPAEHNREELLRVLHLEREGNYLTGIDANVAAWQHTRLGWIWRLLTLPVVRPVVTWFYDRWAQWRYNRLYSPAAGQSPAKTHQTRRQNDAAQVDVEP